MKLLVVAPDYASHVEPMAQIALEWQRSEGEAVVASGNAVRGWLERHGLPWVHLRLGRGSNGGVIRADEQPAGEDDHVRDFFAATRAGAVPTLRYQAVARRHDLLFEPDRVLADLSRVIERVQPDRIIVDHVAFGARLAFHALGLEPATIVLGHPTALPANGEVYGLPPAWPAALQPTRDALDDLVRLCVDSRWELHDAANALLRTLPAACPIGDLASTPGRPTLYMYPSALQDDRRYLPPGAISIGSLRRHEPDDELVLPTGSGPRVLAAFGTFLSARHDLLATATRAAHDGGWRLAMASGSTPIDSLGPPPSGAVVREHLPQVALLAHTDVLVTHGGNNSVTEACAAGVPLVVLPMSTDQFAGASAIERAGVGVVLDPNTLTPAALVDAVNRARSAGFARRCRALALAIADDGGAPAAVRAICDSVDPGPASYGQESALDAVRIRVPASRR